MDFTRFLRGLRTSVNKLRQHKEKKAERLGELDRLLRFFVRHMRSILICMAWSV